MKSAVEWVRFTPNGKPERIQEVHHSDLKLLREEGGQRRIEMWIETTRPGDTTDDRGAAHWDASAQIRITTDPIDFASIGPDGLTIDNVVAKDFGYFDRFIYYWDHGLLANACLSIRPKGGVWMVDLNAVSEAGDRFHCAVRIAK